MTDDSEDQLERRRPTEYTRGMEPMKEWPADLPDQEILWDMKRSGLPKPENVPHELWTNLKKVSYNHENIADLLMLGYTKTEVAVKLGLNITRISIVTRTPTFKAYYNERRKERERIINRDGIHDLFDTAVDTVGEILQSESAKDTTKLDASKFIIEQSVGKAEQKVAVKQTSLLAIAIARYDELKKSSFPEVREKFLVKEPEGFDDVINELEAGTAQVAEPEVIDATSAETEFEPE